jgi:hypothetical protein
MFDEIREAIQSAALDQQKLAMFHFQVLRNAERMSGVDAIEFCRAVDVPVSFASQFRKMVALARIMRESGIQLTAIPTVGSALDEGR